MKKLLVILSMALILTSSIFASGSNEANPETKDGITTIKYAFWGNPDAIGVEKDIIDQFEAIHPTIKVEPIVSGYNDYHSKLMTMIAGGMAPDLMRIDSNNFSDFIALGAIQNLDDYVKKTNLDLDIYPVSSIKEATIGGKLYALPWGTAPYYMMLNLNAFEKAGIALPKIDWTVDDFVKIVKQFKGSNTDCYGYASEISILYFLPFIWADGGTLLSEDKNTFTLDEPKAYNALQTIADLYQEGYLPKDTISAATGTLDRWFINGSIAMKPGSAAEILTTQNVEGLKFEAWTMPGGIAKNSTLYKSNEICMSKDSKVKDAAWEFMKYLRGNEGEKLYVAAKRVPPMLLNDPTLWSLYLDNSKYPKQIKFVTEEIAHVYGHGLPLRKGYAEIVDSLTPILQQVLLGEISAKDVMIQNKSKFQVIIERNNN